MRGVPLALRLVALSLLTAPLAASCGGLTRDSDPILPGGDAGKGASLSPPADAGKDALDGGKDGGKAGSSPKPPVDAGLDAPTDTLPDYVDPGCPDAGLPQTAYECDPQKADDCGPDLACYPFVEYPTKPCGQETYGASCIFAGSGGQGDPCGTGCQAQHVCVVSGQGTQCIRLCNLDDPKPCDGGLVCQPVDIPGLGGCI